MRNVKEAYRHVNSEGERITIEILQKGRFAGRPLLIIHDNQESQLEAMTLLDASTIAWLRESMDEIEAPD